MAITPGTERVLEAAQHWKQTFLLNWRGVLEDNKYGPEVFDEIKNRYVDNLIKGGDATFFEKLKKQMENASPEACKLLSEILWIFHLTVNAARMKQDTKRLQIQRVWNWSGSRLSESEYLQDDVLSGIGYPGTAFNTHKWRELRMAILLFQDWGNLSDTEKEKLCNNYEQFAQWVDEKEYGERRNFRHMLLHLLFPEHFEKIFSVLGKCNALEHFRKQIDSKKRLDIDTALKELRGELEPEYGKNFDFYVIIDNLSKSTFAKNRKKNAVEENQKVFQETLSLNRIFYGPPGTGKTFNTINTAVEILDPKFYEDNKEDREKLRNCFDALKEEGRIDFVTFHQSFGYEDFIEGIKASTKGGTIRYEIESGAFKQMCERATDDPERYVFIIDEINRGNISSIFGELITLIEPSKRQGAEDELSVTLPYSKEPFSVPNNVFIIGTMNTADRSLAILDTALRRRFEFIEMMPNLKILKDLMVENINIADMLEAMNKRIEMLHGREHTIGHTFFLPLKKNNNIETLKDIFKLHIIPLLQEYFFEDWNKIRNVLNNDKKQTETLKFIQKEKTADTQPLYHLNPDALTQPDAYRLIYNDPQTEPKEQ